MHPLPAMILVSSLMTSTSLMAFSSNWLLTWMLLEINTMVILPIMARTQSPRAVEACAKYFIIQSVAATTYLFSGLLNVFSSGNWNLFEASQSFAVALATLGLSLKLGLAPMHSWMPEVLQGIDLLTGLLMSTIQKIAPIIALLTVPNIFPALAMIVGIISIAIGGWAGLNQTQVRKVLAYSSIAHMGWFVSVIVMSQIVAVQTVVIYIFMTSSIFLMLKLNLVHTIHKLGASWAKTPVLAMITPIILLSLAGLPPLSGFSPKMMILREYTQHDLALPATLMAMLALLSLYFYLRMAYAMGLTVYPAPATALATWRPSPSTPVAAPLSVASTSGMMMMPMTPAMTIYLMR
uniref:NADH-ubiquinone oxidoreductase chain 2 n=1 Tax=Peltorhamphus novaezeelandiae TaxID=526620 RepID=W5QKW1_9PLEU|nr:NADH dehydrogenase subunit 2 [Peltorhamphus novaezeelandiae]AFH09399.1 NADH dehydrogenase subunit 2 [Peltorhamphus novaezeelandiae]